MIPAHVEAVRNTSNAAENRAAARTHPQMTIRFRDGEMRVMQPNKEGAYGSEKEADV